MIIDTQYSLDLALFWVLNAKNNLQNAAGFSQFQLVLGRNPKFPSSLSDNLLALSTKPSEVLQDNLKVLHWARWAFIASENDGKSKQFYVLM